MKRNRWRESIGREWERDIDEEEEKKWRVRERMGTEGTHRVGAGVESGSVIRNGVWTGIAWGGREKDQDEATGRENSETDMKREKETWRERDKRLKTVE
jgi:hypothetical protein